jgi:Ca2+/Na+ antiporter
VILIHHTYLFFCLLTGDTFHISDIVMGIAVLAAGGSIPEATSGIINARNGKNSTSLQIISIIVFNWILGGGTWARTKNIP